jgi:hypothetical protein
MTRRSLALAVSLLVLLLARQGRAIEVFVNTESAKAVLLALRNPSLSHEQALTIARMPGNQGTIRKMNEFKIPATDESFARALEAEAHHRKVTEPAETIFAFDTLTPREDLLLNLIQQIEADPRAFQGAIESRIALFALTPADIHLQGYIVAGGDGGGYTFGGTDFYLNIAMNEDFALAKIVTTHELYHAVQGAFAADRGISPEVAENSAKPSKSACASTAELFSNLYEEGTAMYVEDISLLPSAHSPFATKIQSDLKYGLAHLGTSATLLELSVTDLRSSDALSFDDIYDLGFLGEGILYNIGYAMAKSIADNDGPQGLAAYLKQPAYKFVLRYTQLSQYGTDRNHPKLGPNTLAALAQLQRGCK